MGRIIDGTETNGNTESASRAKATLQVDFIETCDVSRIGEVFALRIELDEEYNNGKTCFGLGERAYYRVYASGPYRRGATLGNSFFDALNVGEEVTEEYVEITDFEGAAEKPIWKVKDYEWVGKSLGRIKILKGSDKIITDYDADKDGYGIIKITYETRFNRYYHIVSEEADVIVYAIEIGGWRPGSVVGDYMDPLGNDVTESTSSGSSSGGSRLIDKTTEADTESETISLQKEYITIQYRVSCDVGINDVTIIVKDAITDQVIQGATVTVDGERTGVTNVNGEWYAGKLSSGEHSVNIVANGYQPSSNDQLANDTFEVTPR